MMLANKNSPKTILFDSAANEFLAKESSSNVTGLSIIYHSVMEFMNEYTDSGKKLKINLYSKLWMDRVSQSGHFIAAKANFIHGCHCHPSYMYVFLLVLENALA